MAFKMKGKSPMIKALVGKQHNLPPELKAKIEASPMKKGKKGSHAHGSVSGEKGSKERRLKEKRAKLINKQHSKKKGTLGNAVRKSRVKNINRKLKADGTFYNDKDQGTKSVRDGGRIEF